MLKLSFTLCECIAHVYLAPPSSLKLHVIHATRASQNTGTNDEAGETKRRLMSVKSRTLYIDTSVDTNDV